MRRALIAVSAALILAVVGVTGAGELLSRPAHHLVGDAPPDLEAASVRIPCRAGGTIAGWLIHGQAGQGAVLLLHGVRSDRRQMVGRARFLKEAGYSVLLIDLPSHGESCGERISFGVDEADGVRSALDYLARQLPGEKIGAIGVSLGAASLVLSRPQPAPAAMVLESMFPTIREAVLDRMRLRLGPLGEALAPLLLWQLPLRLGVGPDRIRPIAELPLLHAPVLIADGADDPRTTLAETERLFDAANDPKLLWIVAGAAHQDLFAFDPATYEAMVRSFLARYLRSAGTAA